MQHNNMDEKRNKLKKFIEDSEIPADLKVKELAIVDDWDLSTPEIEAALAKLIAQEFDKKVASVPDIDLSPSKEVQEAFSSYERDAREAEDDLTNDMNIVDDTLKAVREASEAIQQVALEASLGAK
jgi:hypothetical protein